MSNINNLRMGAASLVFKGVSLGHTKGGVVFKADRSLENVTVDQYGDTPIDKILSGQKVTIEVMLAEPTNSNINQIWPEAGDATSATAERVAFGTDAGYSLRADAGPLVLHPLNKAVGDDSEDVNIYLAISTDPVELPYKVKDQRVYKVVFEALISETFGNGRRLGHVGPANIS